MSKNMLDNKANHARLIEIRRDIVYNVDIILERAFPCSFRELLF